MSARPVLFVVLLLLISAPSQALPVSGNIGVDEDSLAGTDGAGRVLLYTPNPVQPGSSISHWDVST